MGIKEQVLNNCGDCGQYFTWVLSLDYNQPENDIQLFSYIFKVLQRK